MDALALQGRAVSLVAGESWRACETDATTVDGAGVLTLAWSVDDAPASPVGGCTARGLAVDRLCRVHRLLEGRVERHRVGPTAGGVDHVRTPEPVLLLGEETPPPVVGPDFTVTAAVPALDPVGIAVDEQDRLHLADGAAREVVVLDLWSRRVVRRIGLPGRPSGLALHGSTLHVVVPGTGLLRLSAATDPVLVPLDLPTGAEARRVTVLPDGSPVVLAVDADGRGWLVLRGRLPRAVGGASDLAVDADGHVVVAPCPGPEGERLLLRRFAPGESDWSTEHPLDATGYDGGGIVRTRDGRMGYFTRAGFRIAVATPVRYAVAGTVLTYRLDCGRHHNRWGRVLLEGSAPNGTTLAVTTAATDDPDAPAPTVGTATASATPVHPRPDPVTPWWPTDPCATTFEAPSTSTPGRYLWVAVVLHGDQRRTPRLRELRVEQTAHSLARRLPAIYSADPAQEDFLHRYLATVDGLLHDLDLRSRCRDLLVDPHGTPGEALDWLASFLGLVLDERWAENARRQLVAEIAGLYRMRGTVWALRRYLQLYLAGDRATDPATALPEPVVLERFRLRHGTAPYAGHAHRFTVLVPQPLDAEAEAVVRHVLETERPAHTAYDLCTVEAGLRVGRGAHLGLSTVVGPTGAFDRAVTGSSVLGRRTILGPPIGELLGSLTRVGRES